ncbi:hypothetical protein [Frankia sp. ArI3]|uniref:hypothetical protein n=1 Tax=Frankia sp. ArI3 TaxID=1858 RepID=UPI001C6FCAA1|nr:hypothetical protein [Frankia sp. ArI3]
MQVDGSAASWEAWERRRVSIWLAEDPTVRPPALRPPAIPAPAPEGPESADAITYASTLRLGQQSAPPMVAPVPRPVEPVSPPVEMTPLEPAATPLEPAALLPEPAVLQVGSTSSSVESAPEPVESAQPEAVLPVVDAVPPAVATPAAPRAFGFSSPESPAPESPETSSSDPALPFDESDLPGLLASPPLEPPRLFDDSAADSTHGEESPPVDGDGVPGPVSPVADLSVYESDAGESDSADSDAGSLAPVNVEDLAVRVDSGRGLVVGEGMAGLAEGLVGQPHVTSVFLPRTEDGELGVASRAGGEVVPVTLEVLRAMLAAAGWRGGPVQVWAPSGPAATAADQNDTDSDSDFDEDPEFSRLVNQLRAFSRNPARWFLLPTEFWLPEQGASQRVVEGRLTAQPGRSGRAWREVRARHIPGESLRVPSWLSVAEDGSLALAEIESPMEWNGVLASVTLADYLDQLPLLQALNRANTGVLDVVLPSHEGGVGMTRPDGTRVRFRDDFEDDPGDGVAGPTFAEFLQRELGDVRHFRALRLWTAGGPGRSERMLERFAASTGLEVLVLDASSHGAFDGAGPRSVDGQGRPTPWRVIGPLADQGASRWESVDGVARPRRDDAVVRTSTGLIQQGSDSSPENVRESPNRDDLYDVRNFRVRRNAAGEPEFMIGRRDGTFYARSPVEMVEFFERHGWNPGRQPLVVAEPLDTYGSDPDWLITLRQEAWRQVGAAAGAFVFAPALDNDVLIAAGLHARVAQRRGRARGARGVWDVLHAPADRPVPLVTDPLGRLWAPDAPAWLQMTGNGLAAPTEVTAQRNLMQYLRPSLGYPPGVFALDLPLLPDGGLGVTLGDGSVRPLAEIGTETVVAAAEAARREPFGTVVLWTPPPDSAAADQNFARDTESLAAAFGRSVVRIQFGMDPFVSRDVPGGPAVRPENRARGVGETGARPLELNIVRPPTGRGDPELSDDRRQVPTRREHHG